MTSKPDPQLAAGPAGARGWMDRPAREAREAAELATWASFAVDSRGRRAAEDQDPMRTVYERDRDRVTHSTAFRRLMYKTQVFLNEEGDHNRTRLSHSLEVCQVARSIGGALRLNEPLCEALALGHDLGHPPFGHRGEVALDGLMEGHGGFRHNAQVLRVVDRLERRSPEHPGLNCTPRTASPRARSWSSRESRTTASREWTACRRS
jgi:dGTPase